MWWNVQRSGLDFCAWSNERFVNRAKLACSADRAFEILADDRMLPKWVHDCTSCGWTSSPPYGVGSTRNVSLKGGLTVREEFIAWEPSKRLTFTLTAMTIPLLRRMIEDFELTADSPTTCVLDWTVHFQSRRIMQPLLPITRPRFAKLFEKSARSLERLVAQNP